jgi:hypothetical protein
MLIFEPRAVHHGQATLFGSRDMTRHMNRILTRYGDHAAGPTHRGMAAEIASRIRAEIISRRGRR